MTVQNANQRLARIMTDTGVSAKSLARSVRELSDRQGEPVACDHTSVSRWLSGTMPRERTAQLIVEVLSTRRGRILTLSDAGFTGYDDQALVEAFGSDTHQMTGPEAVDRLWCADLNNARALVHSSVVVGAWSDAALTWLVRSQKAGATDAAPAIVGVSDVAALRATVTMFAALDGTYGGAHARRSLVQFLQSGLLPLLKGRRGRCLGTELQAAAAEALLLAAWMTYDAGLHGLAQRYFVQALHFADEADDRLLGASILDAMSHQATYLGKLHDAANLASAARSGCSGRLTPSLEAHFAAMEARAFAAAGDAKRTEEALCRAARAFDHRHEGADPRWFDYFDEAELNAELGHCFRDLGRCRDALVHADQAVSGTSARSDFFVTMVKAKSYLSAGPTSKVDLEAACDTVRLALVPAASIKSARCVAYLRDFRASLAPYADEPAVRDLAGEASSNPLWIKCSSPAA